MSEKKTVINEDGFSMPARDGRKYHVHVVSGSHWDREWRFTAVQSKLRLADLVDDLLDMLEANPDYRCFHIDGGAVVLQDYETVRSENIERVRKLVADGRIVQSNWYTLPETNIVSPEALVRNLLVGRRVAGRYGGAMNSGYTATGYGQPSQLPQIYHGFGIDNALFYRGTNKHQTPPVFDWEGRDGSKLMMVRGFDETTRTNWFFYAYYPLGLGKECRHLGYAYRADDHAVHMADEALYDMAFTMLNEKVEYNPDKSKLVEQYQHFRDTFYPYATGNILPGLDIEDNSYPWTHLPALIRDLNEVLDDTVIQQSSMDEMFDAIAREVEGIDLHVEKGELRYAGIEPGFNGLLGMTQSSRTKIKILNDEAETRLIMVAEPLASMASALGHAYPRVNLDEAWTSLLMNHSHDTICGAAVDRAHEDMLYRFSETTSISNEVAKRACQAIWTHVDHGAAPFDGTQVVTLFNVLPYAREHVHPLVIDLPVGSPQERMDMGLPSTDSGVTAVFDLLDENDDAVEYELLSSQPMKMAVEINADANVSFPIERNRILVKTELPAMGYRSLSVQVRPPRYVSDPQPGPARKLIAQPGGILENDLLRVSINSNGTFDMVDKVSGRTYTKLHYFDDRGSTGNAHLDNSPVRDFAVTSLGLNALVTMVESNRLRGTYRIDMTLPLPSYCPGADRAPDMVDNPISVWLTLAKDSPRLEIRTRVENNAQDHRLAVMFPTDIDTETVDVETAFAVETRNFMWKETGDNFESHYAYQPMLSFIDMHDETSGLGFLSKGLREYAVYDDEARTVGLTLIRTHRAYMTAASDLTPTEKTSYPGLQCPGVQEYAYAICPHAGDWRTGRIMEESQSYRAGVTAIQGPAKQGDLPPTQSFIAIEPEGKVMVSAMCQSEDGEATVLRLWNTTDESFTAEIRTALAYTSADLVNLAEDAVGEAVEIRNGKLSVAMSPAKIVTLRLS